MPEISIVIPIYNQEKYLRKCLDSIVAQIFRDFEAILVDDGSTDESARICKEYAQRDSRFVYYRKENGGVSAARQFGHDHVRGTYTIHCDPDDWVEPDWLEALHTEAVRTNADMTICDYYSECNGTSTANSQRPADLSPFSVRRSLLTTLHAACWNKLIRTSRYKENTLAFPNHVNVMEDSVFCVEFLAYCKVISYVERPLYHYCATATSITGSIKKWGVHNCIYAHELIMKLVSDDADLCKKLDEEFPASILWKAWFCEDYSPRHFKAFAWQYRRDIFKSKDMDASRKIILVAASYGPAKLVKWMHQKYLKRKLNKHETIV
jgi:glycosyltransferase involved in cell wall biosynthesis